MKKLYSLLIFFYNGLIYFFTPLIVEIFGGFWNFKSSCKENPNKLKSKIYDNYQHYNSCGISQFSDFRGYPILPHGFFGIFVSAGATIGKNCVIFHHVTIGSNTLLDSKSAGSPSIGDNVYIGAGAKIVGNVHIGNNVRIGANAVVVKDVPENCIVVIDSIKTIIKSEPLDNSFYDYKTFQKLSENIDK